MALILLTIIIIPTFIIMQNNQENTQKQPQPNIVDAKIIVQSNIDWYGSVTCTGPSYGFYTISGSMSDSQGNKEFATYSYNYTVNKIDLEVYGQFSMNFFGDNLLIYDGFVKIFTYINGELKCNQTIKAYSDYDGYEWRYQAGYS